MARSKRKALRIAGVVGVALIGIGSFWTYHRISGSLPRLVGETRLAGLAAEVTVDRDANGVPTIRGASRLDVARALGFLHAQERFFQMDLMRRRAAGELAELVGKGALGLDRYHRLHRMRERARRVVAAASASELELLRVYVAGINEGLEALASPPFEYTLLRSEPKRWELEDSVLVVLSMFFELNDDTGSQESAMGLVHDLLPPELASFLTPPGGEWDAPVSGEPFETPPIPGPDVIDLRKQGGAPANSATLAEDVVVEKDLGSNNWVVAGFENQGWARHPGERHAPRSLRSQHLVSRRPRLWRAYPPPRGGHASGNAHARGGDERLHRLGLHQYRWRLGRPRRARNRPEGPQSISDSRRMALVRRPSRVDCRPRRRARDARSARDHLGPGRRRGSRAPAAGGPLDRPRCRRRQSQARPHGERRLARRSARARPHRRNPSPELRLRRSRRPGSDGRWRDGFRDARDSTGVFPGPGRRARGAGTGTSHPKSTPSSSTRPRDSYGRQTLASSVATCSRR